MASMTFREMNLHVFQGKPIPHPLFQPRIEPWYEWHRVFNRLGKYSRLSMQGYFDDLDVSMRYVHYYTGMPDPVERTYGPEVWVRERRLADGDRLRVVETPYGELTERQHSTVDETWRVTEFMVKQPEDLQKLRWLLDHTTFSFNADNFQRGSDLVGERGEPQFWVPKSPYQALAQAYMKLQHLIYALADCPDEVEKTMEAIDNAYDRLYEELTASGRVKIVNFGENTHQALLSPRYFERYLIPWYEKRCAQLHRAGIFSHTHIDGFFHDLLPYLKDLPFDGIEALTPEPQGDVPLEAIKEHLGDKVLLDGIPAILFMPPYTCDELMAFAERVVKLFHPRLVLGASDEVPEGAPEEAMERVRMLAQWCRAQRG